MHFARQKFGILKPTLLATRKRPTALLTTSSDVSTLVSFGDRLSDIFNRVWQKELAHFPTSITDFWGRALSYQLVDAPSGDPGLTFSSIAEDREYSSAKTPLPLIIADGRSPGEILIPANTTIFEFSPWELGSFGQSVNGFAPLMYIGSRFDKGKLPTCEECINGFDNVGFVMGTSSSLLNQILVELKKVTLPTLDFVVDSILNQLSAQANWDIAIWAPNPFEG
ncbi:lysophospholipase catalytic domain-containing protein [Hirsutella rhossiliensis]|uniref:Lysophospholipase n=1 Tax=Hirsutella rhossiliensis TaxID=111463 RepID=A0A9P8N3D7_9HYPO|nr:lysophospholipase catalytic domain-containing protein [Hirsutella rhossiliensis]KAH0966150.1 lysophospholipase catalytic domain-containing protein [Hirsutella rhossiliensis]